MQILITAKGTLRSLYSDGFPFRDLGPPTITRASHVEPTVNSDWTADLSPVDGPLLGPFELRNDALQAEQLWLEQHWLCPQTRRVPCGEHSRSLPHSFPDGSV